MVGAYLDASVLVALVFDEPSTRDIAQWLSQLDLPLLISDLAAAEVSSAVSIAVRTQREPENAATERLAAFDAWRDASADAMEILPEDFRAADRFVRRFDLKLKTPDALHAAAALRVDAILITLDQRLMRAASALGVEVFSAPTPAS